MFKQLSICAAFLALGTGSLNAEQQETSQLNRLQGESLTKIVVPGADFDIVLATINSQAVTAIDGGRQIDPLDVGLWPTRVYHVPKADMLVSPKK